MSTLTQPIQMPFDTGLDAKFKADDKAQPPSPPSPIGIYVTNMPADLSAREFRLMFTLSPDFLYSELAKDEATHGQTACGRAFFRSHAAATTAQQALDRRMDVFPTSLSSSAMPLRCSFASSSSSRHHSVTALNMNGGLALGASAPAAAPAATASSINSMNGSSRFAFANGMTSSMPSSASSGSTPLDMPHGFSEYYEDTVATNVFSPTSPRSLFPIQHPSMTSMGDFMARGKSVLLESMDNEDFGYLNNTVFSPLSRAAPGPAPGPAPGSTPGSAPGPISNQMTKSTSSSVSPTASVTSSPPLSEAAPPAQSAAPGPISGPAPISAAPTHQPTAAQVVAAAAQKAPSQAPSNPWGRRSSAVTAQGLSRPMQGLSINQSQSQPQPQTQTQTQQTQTQSQSQSQSQPQATSPTSQSPPSDPSKISIPYSPSNSTAAMQVLQSGGRVMPPANPADQNPPCNTLYVGNLPPDTLEDELKGIFSARPGYKRLCFRNKGNGPMCFVEFEDISYASRALEEMYGYGLSNSIKGGIRLSYSKNPLGVRSNGSAPMQSSPVAAARPGVSVGRSQPRFR